MPLIFIICKHCPSDHPIHYAIGRDVVCHVITTYFGKRMLKPDAVSERRQFAWLGHLFVEHPNHKVDFVSTFWWFVLIYSRILLDKSATVS